MRIINLLVLEGLYSFFVIIMTEFLNSEGYSESTVIQKTKIHQLTFCTSGMISVLK